MAKKLLLVLVGLLMIVLALVIRFFFSNTPFDEKAKELLIFTGRTDRAEVMKTITEQDIVRNPRSFEFLAQQMNVWKNIRPGKYRIPQGMSLFQMARLLRNGTQWPVNLVITKVRTKEHLAALIDRKFEADSLSVIQFLNNPDSLTKYDLDTNTVMTAVFPNTYTYLWTTQPEGIFKKLFAEYRKVWNQERRRKADSLNLTPANAYILASIIEEETTYDKEKGLMASVYINRLNRGMPLGADPTVKFALRNFGLKRIYEKHLAVESPYNTYRNRGLPPGPICTPSLKTLDAVLSSPKTDYLFFVAKKDMTQGHIFTSSYREHLRYAREYQQALNQLEQRKRKLAMDEPDHE